MTRAVLDTNVLLSAILFGGKPEQLLKRTRHGQITALTSDCILLELAQVLTNKFSWEQVEVSETVRLLSRNMDIVEPVHKLRVLSDDADNRILECAIEGNADTIISGDHHLLELGEFKGIEILTPSDFLERHRVVPQQENDEV